jgi:hypothetical protein
MLTNIAFLGKKYQNWSKSPSHVGSNEDLMTKYPLH